MESELLDIFRERACKQTATKSDREAHFLQFNDDFFSRCKNFKYCRLCKEAMKNRRDDGGVVEHHRLRSLDGVRKCKYEETMLWVDELVQYKDCLDGMVEIRPYVKSILQLYHMGYDFHPPVVWHHQMLFPGESLAYDLIVEPNPAFEAHGEMETLIEMETPIERETAIEMETAIETSVLCQKDPQVRFKVSFEFFMSWFDVFYIGEYFIVGDRFQPTKPWSLLGDDLHFDDLGYVSLSKNLKDHFGVDVPWVDLRSLTVAQVYTRYFQ